MPYGWFFVFFAIDAGTLHQNSQYAFQLVGMSDSLRPASCRRSFQYWICIVCCLIGKAYQDFFFVLSLYSQVVSIVFLRNRSLIGLMTSLKSSSLPSYAHCPVVCKSNASAYATSGGVPFLSAAAVFSTMSSACICCKSTFAAVFGSNCLTAAARASSSALHEPLAHQTVSCSCAGAWVAKTDIATAVIASPPRKNTFIENFPPVVEFHASSGAGVEPTAR